MPYRSLWGFIREPVNALTHLVGAVLSIIALILLIHRSIEANSITMLTSFIIFGVCMILLYTASTLYHTVTSKDWIQRMRKLDHMMIYALIAGTYTPICLLVIGGPLGITVLAVMWTMALAGILTKLFLGHSAPGWLSIGMYIFMGWAGVSVIPVIFARLPLPAVLWLALGGVIYTVGAVIYGMRKPDPWPDIFGFHAIWHLFVLGGTITHFWAIYRYVGAIS